MFTTKLGGTYCDRPEYKSCNFRLDVLQYSEVVI